MKLFAVAYASLFDNELTIEFHKADTKFDALVQHTRIVEGGNLIHDEHFLKLRYREFEEVQKFFFDTDALVEVTEVPNV